MRRDGHVLPIGAGHHAQLPARGDFRMLARLPTRVRIRLVAFRHRALIEAHHIDLERHIREALGRSSQIRQERREEILQHVRQRLAARQENQRLNNAAQQVHPLRAEGVGDDERRRAFRERREEHRENIRKVHAEKRAVLKEHQAEGRDRPRPRD